eukprot:2715034-Pyramimonas_sp.AAC.1
MRGDARWLQQVQPVRASPQPAAPLICSAWSGGWHLGHFLRGRNFFGASMVSARSFRRDGSSTCWPSRQPCAFASAVVRWPREVSVSVRLFRVHRLRAWLIGQGCVGSDGNAVRVRQPRAGGNADSLRCPLSAASRTAGRLTDAAGVEIGAVACRVGAVALRFELARPQGSASKCVWQNFRMA